MRGRIRTRQRFQVIGCAKAGPGDPYALEAHGNSGMSASTNVAERQESFGRLDPDIDEQHRLASPAGPF